jgi:NADPH:quinone reductase-like Zn-dependent oxidoreductase
VQIAKHLGAKKVIATGRNAEALRSVAAHGADVTIPLAPSAASLEDCLREQFVDGVDVVIDYLWGTSAEQLLMAGAKAGRDRVPIRFVQILTVSGAEITLPSAVLRSTAIELMGSGLGSIHLNRFARCIEDLLRATAAGGFKIATTSVPLSEVATAWPRDVSSRRTVFTMGP